MENKISNARKELQPRFGTLVCFKTEILADVKQVQATIYITGPDGDEILSTGYSHFESVSDIPSKDKEAMVDAIKNYDPSLIK